MRAIVVTFSRVYWRLRITGLEHVPATEAFVLAPVHRSNIDSLVVAALTRRRLRYMAKDAMWKYRLPGRFFTAMGGFPVKRGVVDREALRTCVLVLESGEPVVVFPEGTRRTGPVVESTFEGAAYLAARTGVSIVPVGIGGSERVMGRDHKLPRPGRIDLVVGPPLRAEAVADGSRPSRRAVRELDERLRGELQRLFDESRQRAGA